MVLRKGTTEPDFPRLLAPDSETCKLLQQERANRKRLRHASGQPPFVPVGPSPSRLQWETYISQYLDTARETLTVLPDVYCPDGKVTVVFGFEYARVIPHDAPVELIHMLNLDVISSRVEVLPPPWFEGPPRERLVVIAAGRKDEVANALEQLKGMDYDKLWESFSLEYVAIKKPEDKIHPGTSTNLAFYEVALAFDPNSETCFPRDQFFEYAKSVGAEVMEDWIFTGRCHLFIPVKVQFERLVELAKFSFVRCIADPPLIHKYIKLGQAKEQGYVKAEDPGEMDRLIRFETVKEIDPDAFPDITTRFIIIDAGFPENHPLAKYVKIVKFNPDVPDLPGGPEHGLSAACAAWFGSSIKPGQEAKTPPFPIEIWRVVDAKTNGVGPLDGFTILKRVEMALKSGAFVICNISFGPETQMVDGFIHSWTVVLDHLAFKRNLLLSVAAGNNGDQQNSRIEVPGDGLNILCVGALREWDGGFAPTLKSAHGPGRKPNMIKPDVGARGGADKPSDHPFYVYATSGTSETVTVEGTSFSSPLIAGLAMLLYLELYHQFGIKFDPVMLRALVIQISQMGDAKRTRVGWGRTRTLTELSDGTLWERCSLIPGVVSPGDCAYLPFPTLEGDPDEPVAYTISLAYFSDVSVHDPLHYSLSPLTSVLVKNSGWDAQKGSITQTEWEHAFAEDEGADRATVRKTTKYGTLSEFRDSGIVLFHPIHRHRNQKEVPFALVVSVSRTSDLPESSPANK